MKKIIIVIASLIALSISLCVGCTSAAADWYMFLQNKGWYSFEGESGSTSSTEGSGNSSSQSTTPATTAQAQSGTNTQAQSGSQFVQPSSYIQGSTNTSNK